MGFKPTKPTHKLRIKDKATKVSGTIGSAWLNANGSMSIHLNTGVTLSWKDDVHITAFPVGEEDDPPPFAKRSKADPP